MRVGVVGCGVIGTRRARVAVSAGDEVLAVADVVADRADGLARELGATASTDWREVVAEDGLDAVVVSTFNNALAEVAAAALAAGKHVLCEKPLGRNALEALTVVEAARAAGRTLKVGFNHRHHPAIAKAHELASGGTIGPLFAVRAAYGHGGRAGYEREWRGDPKLAGGGELLDQGVHVVDLCRWFLGEVTEVFGMLATSFWDVGPLEDNGFALLRTADGRTATLHTSWTQWKNLFRFEAFGRDGALTVEGLTGSYGAQRLTLHRRPPDFGAPSEQQWEFPDDDVSWGAEWAEFAAAIEQGRVPIGSGEDGLQAARIIDAIYRSAERREIVTVGDAG